MVPPRYRPHQLTSSSDRLPTISASQALQNASARSHSLTTSLTSLDSALVTPGSLIHQPGIHRGHATEIYGPPGVGKTALAMQVAVNALQEHGGFDKVVWIDTGAPIPGPRFQDILAGYRLPQEVDPPSSPPVARTMDELSTNVTYFYIRTLPHLLTLFMYPTPVFPPPNTSLIVVDNVSTLFATYFPRSSEATITTSAAITSARKTNLQRAANRKFTVAGDLASAMAKTAALKNVAILAINQVATSLRGVRKAVLKPLLSGTAWEAAMYNRIVLFRDFAPAETNDMVEGERKQKLRFAEVLKSEGKARARTVENVVAFVIEEVRH